MITNSLYAIFLLAVCSFADVKDMLLNYDFERVRLTNASRSKVIDLIKQKDFDSVQVIVNFCDSINSPNLEWISPAERFYLEVIKENWTLLKKDSLYIAAFQLADTPEVDKNYPNYYYPEFRTALYSRRLYGENCSSNPSPVPENEDLSKFLRLSYDLKLSQLKKQKPEQAYMWDFFEILFPKKIERWRDDRNSKAKEYLLKYQDSPFFKLIFYNYYFNYKQSGNGMVLGAGATYQFFDKKTAKLLNDRVNVSCNLDVYVKYIPIKIGFMVMSQEINNELIAGKDTIPGKTLLTNMNWMFGTGYLFHIGEKMHFTPYTGLSIFSSFLSDSTKKKLNVDPDIKTLYGLQLGTSFDYQIRPSINDEFYNGFNDLSLLGFRFDMGLILQDFKKLQTGLGNISIYCKLGIQMMGFGRKRVFEIRK
ncbi:MAG: hypothetical protein JW915_09125 [Chitinispirillaceae bacterium]|nr:hypothetical protein [Chitinispirillaceae bacterium]